MQTSTSSLSRYCSRGSKVSSTAANLLVGVVDIALFRSAITIDLGSPAKQRRRAVPYNECHLVAVLETLPEGFKLCLPKGRATDLDIIVRFHTSLYEMIDYCTLHHLPKVSPASKSARAGLMRPVRRFSSRRVAHPTTLGTRVRTLHFYFPEHSPIQRASQSLVLPESCLVYSNWWHLSGPWQTRSTRSSSRSG